MNYVKIDGHSGYVRDKGSGAVLNTNKAEIEAAKANIDVYIKNPVGIGEHPDLVAAMDTEMTKLADASDKLATLNSFYPETAEQFLQEENK